VDVLPSQSTIPGQPGPFTCWNRQPSTHNGPRPITVDVGCRADHFLVSPSMSRMVQDCTVARDYASYSLSENEAFDLQGPLCAADPAYKALVADALRNGPSDHAPVWMSLRPPVRTERDTENWVHTALLRVFDSTICTAALPPTSSSSPSTASDVTATAINQSKDYSPPDDTKAHLNRVIEILKAERDPLAGIVEDDI